MESCIFCKIIKGEIPCTKVYEDDKVLAFLDISPVNKGHTLVIPKKHYETLMDVPDDLLCETMKIIKKLSKAVMKTVKADGINISINNYKAAGQLVLHLHVHIMPRFSNDGLKLDWPTKKIADMDKTADSIRKAL
jgi:histidine triad (HIT) family protein